MVEFVLVEIGPVDFICGRIAAGLAYIVGILLKTFAQSL